MLESAARLHPSIPVVFGMQSKTVLEGPILRHLTKRYPEIKLLNVDPVSWIRSSAAVSDPLIPKKLLDEMENYATIGKHFAGVAWNHKGDAKSRTMEVLVRNLLKYVTLYEHGGVYLDKRLVLTKRLEMRNAVCLQAIANNGKTGLRGEFMHQAALSFEKGHPFVKDAILELVHW